MLRDYQQKGVEQIRAFYSQGHKGVLLHLATGGGKTVVFSYILRETIKNGFKAIMVVRGRELIKQASQRLIRENTPHGVLMANHWLYKPKAPIQICSIDTLRSRGLTPEADLIVIDECHMATSKSYKEFLSKYPNAKILGVTATPYTDKSLEHIASAVVHPISVQTLIDQGFLVKPRYYAPTMPDIEGVKVSASTHDYQQNDLADRMDTNILVGDIVTNWKKFGQNRSSICFAVTIEHSKHIVNCFNQAGIPAEHMDAETPDEDRVQIIERSKNGDTKIISNVGILCTGVDLPHIGCVIMARPTKSYILYIQQAGRGTRPFTDKSDFILLDHAGNILKHGFITDEREANIDPDLPKVEKLKNPKVCAECFACYMEPKCPFCGSAETTHGTRDREIIFTEGELKELTNLDLKAKVRLFIEEHKKIAKAKGYKRGWVYYKLKDQFGEEIANEFMPKRMVPAWVMGRSHIDKSSSGD